MTTEKTSLAAAWSTDSGRVRTNNEDLSVCEPDRGIYAVIDGVGGQAGGEVAASIARTVILERLARPLGTPAERVREAIALANNQIFKSADESPAYYGMTCVVTLALVTDRRLTIGHVGDTRLYKLCPAGIRKLTRDHSPIGEREDAHEISEGDAMRHPRRNEVFRDVGSEPRDKDADGFVDILEDTLDSDSAILLCTDGLSDMVPSSVIEHLVRQHAGNPQAVAGALVSAANEAGGKDNITVVYAEAPEFAPCVRGDQKVSSLARFRRWVVNSRATWFAGGIVAGVLAALLLVWRLGPGTAESGRTFVVGGGGPRAFAHIAEAMARARPGDVVQLEPGIYREQVAVPDGVDLVSRLAGKATLARETGAVGAWNAVTAGGLSGGRIYGIRIESTPEAPVDVGIRASGQGHRIEIIDAEGPMRAAIELSDATGVTIRGCLIHTSRGSAVSMDHGSEATVVNNAFVRAGGPMQPALLVRDPRRTVVTRNVFAGYGTEIVRGVPTSEQQELLFGNFVVGGEPTMTR